MRAAPTFAAPRCAALIAASVVVAASALSGAASSPVHRPAGRTPADAVIRDLGTLGGESSQALGVNSEGWILGSSQVAPGRLVATAQRATLWRDGRIRDLGTLGGPESEARDVNDRGQVVGVAQYDSTRSGNFVKRFRRAFLWEDGRMRDLGTLGGDGSEAHAINDRGMVVGRSQVDPGRRHSTSYHAFLWHEGRMRDLGTLGGTESEAFDVNDRGQVVGVSQYDSLSYGNFVRRFHRAFLWEDGRMRRLGTLGGGASRAYAVNERGQVVGVSLTEEGEPHAFLWEDGRMRDLGTLGGPESRAHDIDERGRVVGASVTAGGEVHAFLWEDGEMRDLGSLSDNSRARAIGGENLVVGASRTARTASGRVAVHAVAWELGGR